MTTQPLLCLALLTVVGLAACGSTSSSPPGSSAPASSATASSTAADVGAIAKAIAATDRSAEDRAEDVWRKPATVLQFTQARPGMHVIDVFAAGGYYSELLARVVGSTGRVIAYNNPPYAKYATEKDAHRFVKGRFPNVEVVTAEVPDLSLAPGSLDAALFVLSYHDLYWRPAEGGWEKTDPVLMLQKLHTALKPGGIVVVLDHVAKRGTDPKAVADELHRIDPDRVRADFAAAGFEFDAKSDAFAHPQDDLTKLVFDPAIRHKTDQFLYRFRKPGAP